MNLRLKKEKLARRMFMLIISHQISLSEHNWGKIDSAKVLIYGVSEGQKLVVKLKIFLLHKTLNNR